MYNYQKECYNLYEKNNYNINVLSNQKPILLVIFGIEQFKNKLNIENQNIFGDFFTISKDLNIINFIIIDSVDNLKKFEYDSWFNTNFNDSNGIWIGNGLDEQFLLKVSIRTEQVKSTINNDMCFVLVHGKPVLVKYVSGFEKND